MNAMIRVLKGTLAVLALAALGLALRWMTAGSISGVRTYDLDSLTVLAVGTVAWIAYGWLVLAVLMTVLEQIPGVVGALAGAVAGRITTKTARAILRSGLGVAAVTPLTVGVAHASPGDSAHVRQWDQTEPKSTVNLGNTNYRATEPRSSVEIGGTEANYRATEPRSTVEIGGTEANYRATEPRSTVEIGGADTNPPATSADNTTARSSANTQPSTANQSSANTQSSAGTAERGATDYRATEPRSTVEIGGADTNRPATSADQNTTRASTNTQSSASKQSSTGTQSSAGTQERSTAKYRATEPRSTVEIGGTEANYRATEPRSTVEIGGAGTDRTTPGQPTGSRTGGNPTAPGTPTASGRPTTSAASTKPSSPTTPGDPTTPGTPGIPGTPGTPGRPAAPAQPGAERPTDARMRMGVPDRPTDGAPTRYTELRPRVPVRVVVREGDSLWSIAARELGPGATDAAIAARWPAWYAANRHVIGDDPGLILPGQVLRIPPTHGDHLPTTHQEK
ncbi:LysM peptidoglycan-binding domain-containing protein [Kribbella sp. NPDC054772]